MHQDSADRFFMHLRNNYLMRCFRERSLPEACPKRSVRVDPPQSALCPRLKVGWQFGAKYSPEYRFIPTLPAYNLFRMCGRPIRRHLNTWKSQVRILLCPPIINPIQSDEV